MHIDDQGFPVLRGRRLRLRVSEIAERYMRPEAAFDISLAAGCSDTAILAILRDIGVPVRPRGRACRPQGSFCAAKAA